MHGAPSTEASCMAPLARTTDYLTWRGVTIDTVIHEAPRGY